MQSSGPSPKGTGDSEKSAKTTTGVGEILRRHSRVLTVLGALIVFLTFIVKEERGEALKSLTDSIDAAETLFALHQAQIVSQHTIQDRLTENDMHTLTAEAMSDESERDRIAIQQDRIAALKEHWRQNIESARAYDDGAELALSRASKFIKKLQTGALTKELDTEVNQREKERQVHQGSIGEVSKAIDSYQLKRTADGKFVHTEVGGGVMKFQTTSDMEPDVIQDTSRQLASQGKTLSDAVDVTVRRIFERADEISRSKAEAYQNTKRWAVVLYVVGWAIGLLGKLYDVKGLSGDE